MDPENVIFGFGPLALAIASTLLGAMWLMKKKKGLAFVFELIASASAFYFLYQEGWHLNQDAFSMIATSGLLASLSLILWLIYSALIANENGA